MIDHQLHEGFMQEAFKEAFNGMRNNKGGPFGAVIVKDGAIIGRGCNQVTSTNDPTAHAEINAIRQACRQAGTFHLTGAVLYATSEPCPMCLSAIYWADIQQIFYAADREAAARVGFSDAFIYDEFLKPITRRTIPLNTLPVAEAKALFEEWEHKSDKTLY
jgi:guanine deaminase